MVGRGDRTQATAATEEGSTERTQRGGARRPTGGACAAAPPPRPTGEPRSRPAARTGGGISGTAPRGGPAREARRRSGAAEAGGAAEEAPKDGEGERRAPTPHHETEETYWSRLDKAADREEPGTPRSGRGGRGAGGLGGRAAAHFGRRSGQNCAKKGGVWPGANAPGQGPTSRGTFFLARGGRLRPPLAKRPEWGRTKPRPPRLSCGGVRQAGSEVSGRLGTSLDYDGSA